MFQLKLLGGASIESDGVPLSGTVAQRRRLALLALLARSPGGMSRERLVAYLFPDVDSARAHRALSDALHAIRRALGKDAVTSAGDQLHLNPTLVAADVAEFDSAVRAAELERAVSLYRGPFLDGFFVADAPDFERWVDAERDRLGRQYADALESLAARQEAAGDIPAAVEWLRKLATADPFNSRVAIRLVTALESTGDRGGALRHARAHQALLKEELGIASPPDVAAAVARLQAAPVAEAGVRPASVPVSVTPAPSVTPSPSAAPSPSVLPPPSVASPSSAASAPAVTSAAAAPLPHRPARWRRRGMAVVAVLAILLALLVPILSRARPDSAAAPSTGTSLVVFPIASPGDSATTTLAQGITDLLGRNLDGAGDLHVLNPGVVHRRALQRLGSDGSDVGQAAALAAELGATRFVVGSLVESGGQVRVHLTLHETGNPDRALARVTADKPDRDLFGLTDQLTAELLGVLVGPASRQAARTAALTSSSLPAVKEFLRAEHAFRFANYDSAIAGFQRAVSLDTGFALANFRLAVASGLYDRERIFSSVATEGGASTALERALALANRLSERDRRLLEAYDAYRLGAADEAERRFRAHLRDYPDDIEARFLLAELQYRYNALRGRDPGEARADYLAVLQTDPDFFCPI